MQQNSWLLERLTEEHKRELMREAEAARQAQSARQAAEKQSENLLQKLHAELMSMNKRLQSDARENNR